MSALCSRLGVLALLVTGPGLAASGPGVQAAELIRGRCHMDTCIWLSLEEKDLIGTDRTGALFRVVTKA